MHFTWPVSHHLSEYSGVNIHVDIISVNIYSNSYILISHLKKQILNW